MEKDLKEIREEELEGELCSQDYEKENTGNNRHLRQSMSRINTNSNVECFKFNRASKGFGTEKNDKNNEENTNNNLHSVNSSDSLRGSTGFRSSFAFTGLRGSVGVFNDENSVNSLSQRSTMSSFSSRGSTTGNISSSLSNFDSRAAVYKLEKKTEEESNEETNRITTIVTEKYKYIGSLNREKKREGFGVCYYQNGDKYSGNWKDDKKEGWGRYFIKSACKTFQGEFKNNQIDGFVEYINKGGVKHLGMMKVMKFVNQEVMIIQHPKYELTGVMEFNTSIGKLAGLARINYKNGTLYEGETIESMESGWGVTKSPDGTLVRGEKSPDKVFNSYCEIEYPSGEKYCGWFLNNKKNGVGISIKDGVYTIGKYSADIKDGGFVSCCMGEAKFELHLFGFLTKTVEKKENILSYLNLVYPEYKWLYKANNKLLAELICNAGKD